MNYKIFFVFFTSFDVPKRNLRVNLSQFRLINASFDIYQSIDSHIQHIKNTLKILQNQANLWMSKLTLGYWGIRGRAQVTRLVCAYTGVEWEQKTYTSPEQWFGKDKQQLGILFPNLPYIIDDDIKITESDILPRYVIKKSGKQHLLGHNPRQMALVDNVIYVVLDLWNPVSQLFFNKKWQDEKTGVFYSLKSKFAKLQKFINGKQTTMGYLTLADFFISQFSYYVEKLFPEEYSKFKSIQNIRSTIQGLEAVKNYYSQSNSVQAAFLPPQMTVFPFLHEKFQPKTPVMSLMNSSITPKKSQKPQKTKEYAINNGQKLKIVIIPGSLRKASTNRGLLRACVQLNSPNIQFQWAQISDIPLFNEDIQEKTPSSVQILRNQVKKAHGILFGVTQNNSSPSAAMKNAYDWLSRGGQRAAVYQIPAGMISVGADRGGLRAQKALKNIGQYCQVKFMTSPQISINRFQGNYFDQNGNLTDQGIREKLRQFLHALALWVDAHKKK